MILEAKDLSFRYQSGNRQILNHFSIRIASGERVGLAAPSGFGKTTLCKILAGYEMPDAGEVLLDGAPLTRYKGYCPVQLIWQHPEQALNPRLRMEDSLYEAGDVETRIMDGLCIEAAWLKRFPAELSGGEMQRFCIARALGEKTKFLLCDEITTMLDLITQSQIWGFLAAEASRRGIGLLAVSHAAPLLDRICTRQIALDAP